VRTVVFDIPAIDGGLQHRRDGRADATKRAVRVSFLPKFREQRFHLRAVHVRQGTGTELGKNVPLELEVVIPHRTLLHSQLRVRAPLLAYKFGEGSNCLRSALVEIFSPEFLVEDGTRKLPRYVSDGPERFGALQAFHRTVRLQNVLPPPDHPHSSSFSTNDETTFLVPRSSHSFLSADSSASFCCGNVPGRTMSDQDVTDVVAWLASQRTQRLPQSNADSNSAQHQESNHAQ